MKNRNLFSLIQIATLSVGLPLAMSQPADKIYVSEGQRFKVETLVSGREVLWGFDFLPDGRALLTEKSGKILLFDLKTRKLTEVPGAPTIAHVGQGGLLDIRVHPDFANNKRIYLSYATPVGAGTQTTAVAYGDFDGVKVKNLRRVFIAEPANANDIHFGSRIEFDRRGHIFFTVGDRNARDKVQDLGATTGKLLRLTDDGKVPADNPFVNTPGAKPEIYALGLRSPQGLAYHYDRDVLYEAEMGPLGGDEVNLIKPGMNLGWPVITYGREYSGGKIGEGTAKAGMEQPIVYWVPSISPSGVAWYTSDAFAKWKGHLFLGNLSGQHLRRIVIDASHKVTQQEELLKDLGWRFRNVRTGPEGFVYISTDEGRFARLVPVR